MTTAITKPIALKNGNDEAVAERLTAMHAELEDFATKSFLLGIYAHYIKEVELPKNQFGRWLQQHAPKLCRFDSENGWAKPTSTLSRHLDFAKEVVEHFGLSLNTALNRIKTLTNGGFPTVGKLNTLLIEDAEKSTKVIPKHEEFINLLANKSRRQVVHTLVQMEEDENGVEHKKRGRLKGQGGATKEQRAKAAAAEEAARVAAIELTAEEFAEWLDEHADAKGLGQITGTDAFKKLLTAMENALPAMKKFTKGNAQ